MQLTLTTLPFQHSQVPEIPRKSLKQPKTVTSGAHHQRVCPPHCVVQALSLQSKPVVPCWQLHLVPSVEHCESIGHVLPFEHDEPADCCWHS